ncbi:MAG TPA: glycosyltransferase family 2 protein, partial [Pirellulaceae bacterium]
MPCRYLTALPVFNEQAHVNGVLDQVRRHTTEILVVDDGSTDETAAILQRRNDIQLLRHRRNLGYGGALRTAFDYAIRQEYDVLVTIDCDGQHEPQLIPGFADACRDVDLVSGSRYLLDFAEDSAAPEDRRRINQIITRELNQQFELSITDAFCGFKAYRVTSLRRLRLSEDGYAMPLQLWVQAARLGLRIRELPVPRIYLDAKRSFGGALDDAETRLA